jgi:hypothetical protein
MYVPNPLIETVDNLVLALDQAANYHDDKGNTSLAAYYRKHADIGRAAAKRHKSVWQASDG